jgi:hypothetical protein
LELLRGFLSRLGVVGLVGAFNLGGVVFGGGGWINVKGRRDRVQIRT